MSSLDLKEKPAMPSEKLCFQLFKKRPYFQRNKQKKKKQLVIIPVNKMQMSERKNTKKQSIIHSLREKKSCDDQARRIKTQTEEENICLQEPLRELLETLRESKNRKRKSLLLKIDGCKNTHSRINSSSRNNLAQNPVPFSNSK